MRAFLIILAVVLYSEVGGWKHRICSYEGGRCWRISSFNIHSHRKSSSCRRYGKIWNSLGSSGKCPGSVQKGCKEHEATIGSEDRGMPNLLNLLFTQTKATKATPRNCLLRASPRFQRRRQAPRNKGISAESREVLM